MTMRWCRLLSRLVSQQGVNREVGTFRDIRRRCSERSDLGLQARPRDCLLAWQRRGFVLSGRGSWLLLVHALVRWRFAFLLLAGSHQCTHLASKNRSLRWSLVVVSHQPRGNRFLTHHHLLSSAFKMGWALAGFLLFGSSAHQKVVFFKKVF